MAPILSPRALIEPADLQARLKRAEGGEDDLELRLVSAINAATHWMEAHTRRALKLRNWKEPVTLSGCTVSSGTAAMTGSGFTASVDAGDDCVGTGLQVGSQVLSVTSNTALTLTRNATGAVSGSVTFGSRALRVSGEGTREVYLPERPIVELLGIQYDDGSGTLTALDITDAIIEPETGRILLVNDSFAEGELNHLVSVRAGYSAPSATSLGHNDWYLLEAAALRASEVFFTDALNIRGRADSISAGGVSASMSGDAMPADLLAMLAPFVRRW